MHQEHANMWSGWVVVSWKPEGQSLESGDAVNLEPWCSYFHNTNGTESPKLVAGLSPNHKGMAVANIDLKCFRHFFNICRVENSGILYWREKRSVWLLALHINLVQTQNIQTSITKKKKKMNRKLLTGLE